MYFDAQRNKTANSQESGIPWLAVKCKNSRLHAFNCHGHSRGSGQSHVWGPRHNSLLPFLDTTATCQLTPRHLNACAPFSASNCIGQRFALMEEMTVLPKLLRRLRITKVSSVEEVRPVREMLNISSKDDMDDIPPLEAVGEEWTRYPVCIFLGFLFWENPK